MHHPQSTALLCAFLLIASCAREPQRGAAPATAEQTSSEMPPAAFRVPARALERLSIESAPCAPADLARTIQLPGSIQFANDARATVTASLDGQIAEVLVRQGERVERGQLLAVLHSRELARARSDYVEAVHHLEFARTAFDREARLWQRRITSEENYLSAEHAVEEAQLELHAAGQELSVLGVQDEELEALSVHLVAESSDGESVVPDLTRFERRAPIRGTVVEWSAILGQAVRGDERLFEIADLSRVWVEMRVRAADLACVAPGRDVRVDCKEIGLTATAQVGWVQPQVDERTQTALARAVLDNPAGAWRPGLFVTVETTAPIRRVDFAVPLAALQSTPEGKLVFVQLGPDHFEARRVEVGDDDGIHVEVRAGLQVGERVATSETLTLKSLWAAHGSQSE